MRSPPRISWSDLRSARAGVWGLGIEGRACLRRLRALGAEPVLVDDRPPAPEVDGLPVHGLGSGGLELLEGCDVVVKSPGVSRHRPEVARLEERRVPVVGGLGLWMEEVDRRRVACVTGTKGKSTTVALCGHLLRNLGRDVFVGGNLGTPPYDPDVGPHELYVVETSSFQATDLASAPPVVAVTALAPDHLDWHGDTETYYRDKLSLCTKPGADLVVADGSSAVLRAHAELLGPHVRWVVDDDPEPGGEGGYVQAAGGDGGSRGDWTDALGLCGRHNRHNALIARAVLEALGVEEASDDSSLAAAARDFTVLDSRLQAVAAVERVTFVDDSLSTNVLAALAALATFPGGALALIVGGQDRGIDYDPLARALLRRDAPTFVVTLPGAGRRIAAALERLGGETGRTRAAGARGEMVTVVDTMDEAVRAAFATVRPEGVVLLSPAAPSFGQFRDYRERAAAFRAAAARCRPAGGG